MTTGLQTPAAADRRTLATVLYERLRRDMACGELKPGERLRLTELASEYDCNMGAVREALSRLAGEGFATFQDRRGWAVAGVSRAELIDLTDTRLILEEQGLKLAMQRGGIDWESDVVAAFHRLKFYHDQSEREGRGTTVYRDESWYQSHTALHRSFVAGCNSPLFMQLYDFIYAKGDRYRRLHHKYQDIGDRDVAGEHQALTDAVLRRDHPEAVRLMNLHLRTTVTNLLRAPFFDEPDPGS